MGEATRRFKWPIPDWNAKYQEWQRTFRTLVNSVDAEMFASLEQLKLIPKQLPSVEVIEDEEGACFLRPDGDSVFVSRTLHTEIVVSSNELELEPDGIVGVQFTSGAVGKQHVDWELRSGGLPVDASWQPLGYVDVDMTVIWFNGGFLPPGILKKLFSFEGDGSVKISGSDDSGGYLIDKLVAGDGIEITLLNPGGNELIEISATGGAPDILTGNGNPNGLVSADVGAEYLDTTNVIFYKNIGGQAWVVD